MLSRMKDASINAHLWLEIECDEDIDGIIWKGIEENALSLRDAVAQRSLR